jgi:hypothetical protein
VKNAKTVPEATPRKEFGRPVKPPPAFVEREFAQLAPANAADVIERMAAEGTPLSLIARELGTSTDTLRRWRREHPTLQEAFEVGRGQLELALIKEVRSGSREYARSMFLLKTIFGYREQGEPPASVNQVQVNIALPGSMTMDAFREMRNAVGTQSERAGDERLPNARPGITARA